jgi:hypothetical protein
VIASLTSDEVMRATGTTWATEAGVSLLSLAYHCAFSQALVLDLMWMSRETTPQRSADAAGSPCAVTWSSAFPSTEGESSEFSHSWKITLT